MCWFELTIKLCRNENLCLAASKINFFIIPALVRITDMLNSEYVVFEVIVRLYRVHDNIFQHIHCVVDTALITITIGSSCVRAKGRGREQEIVGEGGGEREREHDILSRTTYIMT